MRVFDCIGVSGAKIPLQTVGESGSWVTPSIAIRAVMSSAIAGVAVAAAGREAGVTAPSSVACGAELVRWRCAGLAPPAPSLDLRLHRSTTSVHRSKGASAASRRRNQALVGAGFGEHASQAKPSGYSGYPKVGCPKPSRQVRTVTANPSGTSSAVVCNCTRCPVSIEGRHESKATTRQAKARLHAILRVI